MRTGVWLLAALLLPLPAHAQAPPSPGASHVPKTGFLPSIDLLQVPNPSGRGTATGGSCHGLVEAALVYRARREADPSAPPLAEVGREIERRFGATEGQRILHGLAVAEQHHVYQQTVQRVQTDDAKRTVFENLKTSLDAGQPVRLSLVSESGAGHMVVAWDYGRDADGDFVFRIGDPNHPSDDTRTITFVRGDPNAPIESEARRGAFEPNGAGRRAMEVFAVQAPIERQPARMVEMIDEARRGQVPRSDFVPPPGLELRDEGQAEAVRDPSVGGVLLRFPAAIYDPGQVSDRDYDRVMGEVRRFLASGREGGVVISGGMREEALSVVPVDALLAPGATTVGPITGIRGWVRADGRLFILGVVEPGREPVPLDLLSVALELVWRRGNTPWISLDPDKVDPFGIQRERTGDIPPDFQDTAFVRAMFAADYAMKALSLGVRATSVAGYRSIERRLREGEGGSDDVLFRLWLAPLALPGADVLEARGAGGDVAVRFESRVQVMTETMVNQDGILVGTGLRDPVAEGTAEDFTRLYDALAAEVPALGRLATVFAVSKLAALWRGHGVDDPALTRLAERAVGHRAASAGASADDDGPPWKGIGPLPVAGTDRVIGGGAIARFRVRAAAVARGEDVDRELGQLIGAARRGESGQVRVTLPARADLEAAAAGAAALELELLEAVARLRDGDLDAALAGLDRVLTSEPREVEALTLRAIARTAGRRPGALEDAALAAAIDPRQAALHAMIAAESDDPGVRRDALREAEAAVARDPEDGRVLLLATLAHLGAGDLEGTQQAFARLARVAPYEAGTRHLDGLLALLNGGAMTRAEALERLVMMRRLPVEVQMRVKAGADLIDIDPRAAVLRLSEALSLAEASAEPAVRTLAVVERVRFMRVLARYRALGVSAEASERADSEAGGSDEGTGGAGRSEETREEALAAARADADRLVESHPDWASGHLARMWVLDAAGASESEVVAAFTAAAEAERARRDPVLGELGVVMGAARPVVLFGLMTAWGRMQQGEGRALFEAATLASDEPIRAPLAALLQQTRDGFELPRFLAERGEPERRLGPREEVQRAERLERDLAALQAVVATVPTEPQEDAVALWFLPLLFKAYLPLAQELGTSSALLDGATRYLSATRRALVRSPFAEAALELRAGAAMMAAAAIAAAATEVLRKDGEALEGHAKALEGAGTGADAALVGEHLDALADGLERLVSEARQSVAAAIAGLERDPATRALVVLVLGVEQRSMGSRAAPEALIRRLEAIPGVGGGAALERFMAAVGEAEAGVFVRGELSTALDAVAREGARDAVSAETTRRALRQLRGWLGHEGREGADIDAALAKVMAELDARRRLGAFSAGTGAADSFAPTPEPALPWLPIAVAIALLGLSLATFMALRRK